MAATRAVRFHGLGPSEDQDFKIIYKAGLTQIRAFPNVGPVVFKLHI